MGTGQSIGRNSWRYACSDDSDWDFEGHKDGVHGGFRQPRGRSTRIDKGKQWIKQHEILHSHYVKQGDKNSTSRATFSVQENN